MWRWKKEFVRIHPFSHPHVKEKCSLACETISIYIYRFTLLSSEFFVSDPIYTLTFFKLTFTFFSSTELVIEVIEAISVARSVAIDQGCILTSILTNYSAPPCPGYVYSINCKLGVMNDVMLEVEWPVL